MTNYFLGLISAIISIIIVVALFYLKWRFSKHANPINTLSYKGFLGFNLGDHRDFVISRINRLNLLSEDDKINIEYKRRLNFESGHIQTSNKLYNNIDEISFIIVNDRLSYMKVRFFEDKSDIRSIIEYMLVELKTKFGNPKEDKDGYFLWENGTNCIVFYVNNKVEKDVCITVEYKNTFYNRIRCAV